MTLHARIKHARIVEPLQFAITTVTGSSKFSGKPVKPPIYRYERGRNRGHQISLIVRCKRAFQDETIAHFLAKV